MTVKNEEIMNFKESYFGILKENGLEEFATDALAERFSELTDRLLAYNEGVNLTAITDPEQIILRHYADCLKAVHAFPQNAKVLDVGCGGGFPCLPLAIARPDLTVVGLDSTEKKLRFVESAAKGMGLRLSTVAGRAEELSHTEMRESFDVVTARAVAALNVLSEWCLPFVKVGGIFLAMKGVAGFEEYQEAEIGIEKLGGREEQSLQYDLHLLDQSEKRTLIQIRKEYKTPREFPRVFGAIKKRPL
jgi:16S rRNA (guanine527-N7)-methyltransferase